jgi:signal transduction histidine kinase
MHPGEPGPRRHLQYHRHNIGPSDRLGNAVDAMSSAEEGARELTISTEPSRTEGILVAVRDSGPGIDPEHLDRIFESFHTTKTSGLGMGLSICRSIIDAHGGRLWAEANQPRGAVFRFTLPPAVEDS